MEGGAIFTLQMQILELGVAKRWAQEGAWRGGTGVAEEGGSYCCPHRRTAQLCFRGWVCRVHTHPPARESLRASLYPEASTQGGPGVFQGALVSQDTPQGKFSFGERLAVLPATLSLPQTLHCAQQLAARGPSKFRRTKLNSSGQKFPSSTFGLQNCVSTEPSSAPLRSHTAGQGRARLTLPHHGHTQRSPAGSNYWKVNQKADYTRLT